MKETGRSVRAVRTDLDKDMKAKTPKRRPYYATMDRNGTEDEITIRSPRGRAMAVIQFWDEPDIPEAKRHKCDAALIVNALNAYRWQTPDTRRRGWGNEVP